jgi:hypothetical protein
VIVTCGNCRIRFDDEFRTTICPHGTFAANDGQNNFTHHPEAFLGTEPESPQGWILEWGPADEIYQSPFCIEDEAEARASAGAATQEPNRTVGEQKLGAGLEK